LGARKAAKAAKKKSYRLSGARLVTAAGEHGARRRAVQITPESCLGTHANTLDKGHLGPGAFGRSIDRKAVKN
jgi:hypothetical protein